MDWPEVEYGQKHSQHVTFANTFAIGKTELTRGQFAEFANETGYVTDDTCNTIEDGTTGVRSGRNWRNPGYTQEDNHPVVCVSWDDAQAYVKWLSKKTGWQYRMPSEAEWEYACRAGLMQQYCGSDDVDKVAWYKNNSGQSTHQVAKRQPNRWGLYDMSGNVREWVAYARQPTSSPAEQNIVRSGGWNDTAQFVKVDFRLERISSERDALLGFRIVRIIPVIPWPGYSYH